MLEYLIYYGARLKLIRVIGVRVDDCDVRAARLVVAYRYALYDDISSVAEFLG